jgi:hypothetical protein
VTFLSPIFLALGGAAAVLLTALHLITRDRPPRTILPTARFVPESAASITSRTIRLSDRALLLLRVLALLAAGAAMAGPVIAPTRAAEVRVLLVDVSRAVADAAEARDSVQAIARAGDVLVMFDSTAYPAAAVDGDSIPAIATSGARGSVSVALAAGFREAAALRQRADSVELVLLSPLAEEEVDAATAALRALHDGRVRVVRLRAAPELRPSWEEPAQPRGDDAIMYALSAGWRAASGEGDDGAEVARYVVRVARGALSPTDSQWVAAPGRVLVHWPVVIPNAWRGTTDSISALVAGRKVLLAPFERTAAPPVGHRVAARWGDGAPAATEVVTTGGGCLRTVAVSVPAAGDLVLRPAFQSFVREMIAPCGGHTQLQPVSDTFADSLQGDGRLLGTAELGRESRRSPLTPWLLGIAIAALIVEIPVRSRRRG